MVIIQGVSSILIHPLVVMEVLWEGLCTNTKRLLRLEPAVQMDDPAKAVTIPSPLPPSRIGDGW